MHKDLNYLLLTTLRAVYLAGKEILCVYESDDFEIQLKSDNSPLTKADKNAHLVISKNLDGSYPILSEEGKNISYEERKQWNTFWMVDPLDGTKEFIQVLRLLEKHPLPRLTRAVEQALSIHALTCDAVALFLYPDEPWRPPTFRLDGREHLQGVVIQAPDVKAYACLRPGGLS